MNLAGCRRLSFSPLTGHWFRDYSSRISDVGTAASSYRMLYLGENHQAAIYEVGALLGDPNDPLSNPRGSWALMSIKVVLHHIADLSDLDQQQLIATNYQELTGSWVNSPRPAPTQQLGASLHALPRLEGFLYPSAKSKSRNLAIFMEKLDKKSRITFLNELTGQLESIA